MTTNSLFRIIISSFVIKAMGAGLAVLMFIMISRTTTTAEFGEFSFGFSFAQFAGVVLGFGTQTAMLRDTSSSIGMNDWAKARTTASRLWSVAGFGWLVTLILAFCSMLFGFNTAFVFSVAVLSILFAAAELLSAMIRGYGGVLSALAPREVIWRLVVIALAGMLMVQAQNLEGTQWLIILCVLLFIVIALQWCRFKDHPRVVDLRRERKWGSVVAVLRNHWGLWLVTIFETINVQFPVMIVRGLLDAHSTALFFAAIKIAAVVALPLLASGPVVAPQISRAWANRDLDMLRRIGRQTALFTSLGTLVGVVIVFVTGRWFLRLFGDDFVCDPILLLVLVGAQFFGALMGPTGFTMLMIGHERANLVFMAFAAVIAVALMLTLTMWIGLIGAAIGCSSLLLINKICSYYFIWNRYGVHLSLFGFLQKRTLGAGA